MERNTNNQMVNFFQLRKIFTQFNKYFIKQDRSKKSYVDLIFNIFFLIN